MNSALKFLNLIDRAGRLSITNVAVYGLLLKLLASPGLDWPVVAGLLVTLLNYGHKRSKEVIQAPVVETPQIDLTAINAAIDDATKIAKEAKDIAQKLGVANAFSKLK